MFRPHWRGRSDRQSGQAAVESALTLPLVVFMFLGTTQLFMMMHGRILTQVAAYRATRVGSVSHGHCGRMVHAALLSVTPAIESYMRPGGGTPGSKLAAAFRRRINNRFNDRASDGGNVLAYTGDIIWIIRRSPTIAQVNAASGGDGQDVDFDQPNNLMRLETEVIFWYPMRIPFANWVMSRMFLANFRLQNYAYQNPLMPVRRSADFASQDWLATTGNPAFNLNAAIATELHTRINRKEFVFPIHASYGMRMMTPAKQGNFRTQHCPPTPAGI